MSSRWLNRSVLVASLALSGAASAEGWDWKIAPYIWAAGLAGDTGVGDAESDVNLNVSALWDFGINAAAFLRVQVANGGNAFFGDLPYVSLGSSADTVVGDIDADLSGWLFEGGYLRRWPYAQGSNGLELGLRYLDLELGMDLEGPTAEISRRQDWFDYFAGYRLEWKM